MAEEIAASGSTCPWCSASLPDAAVEECPSCGAHLVPESDAQVPGVTAIDAEAIVRAARQPTSPRRNRLLSWISGEYDGDAEAPVTRGSLSPPDLAVRREMLRLELAAEVANLQGEAGLVMAEAADAEGAPDAVEVADAEGAAERDAAPADQPGHVTVDGEPEAASDAPPSTGRS